MKFAVREVRGVATTCRSPRFLRNAVVALALVPALRRSLTAQRAIVAIRRFAHATARKCARVRSIKRRSISSPAVALSDNVRAIRSRFLVCTLRLIIRALLARSRVQSRSSSRDSRRIRNTYLFTYNRRECVRRSEKEGGY